MLKRCMEEHERNLRWKEIQNFEFLYEESQDYDILEDNFNKTDIQLAICLSCVEIMRTLNIIGVYVVDVSDAIWSRIIRSFPDLSKFESQMLLDRLEEEYGWKNFDRRKNALWVWKNTRLHGKLPEMMFKEVVKLIWLQFTSTSFN